MNYRSSLLAIFTLLTIVGCTVDSSCNLYNHTDKEIKLELIYADKVVDGPIVAPDEMTTINNWGSLREIRIHSTNAKNKAWVYGFPPQIPVEQWKWKGWWIFASHYFDAQLESDGSVNVIGATHKYPITPNESVLLIQPSDT